MKTELLQITRVSGMQNGVPICVEHKGVPYCVVQMNGSPEAFIAICSHREKKFVPEIKENCVICPFHQVYFNPKNGSVVRRNRQDVPRGLSKVTTEILNGDLHIVIEDTHAKLVADAAAKRSLRKEQKKRRRWLGLF